VLRSPLFRAILGILGVVLFYLLGVAVRRHFGSVLDIQNSAGETMHQVSVNVKSGGKSIDLADIKPGDHRKVYVNPPSLSEVTMTITDSRNRRDVLVFSRAQPDECALSVVKFLPGHRTESVETHESNCWKGWMAF
jgi:hypothetical protein